MSSVDLHRVIRRRNLNRSKFEQFTAETLHKNSVKPKNAVYESYGCFKDTEGPPARSSSLLTGRKLCGKAYNIVAIVQQLSQLKPVSAPTPTDGSAAGSRPPELHCDDFI